MAEFESTTLVEAAGGHVHILCLDLELAAGPRFGSLLNPLDEGSSHAATSFDSFNHGLHGRKLGRDIAARPPGLGGGACRTRGRWNTLTRTHRGANSLNEGLGWNG
jgi:hypothetical protein